MSCNEIFAFFNCGQVILLPVCHIFPFSLKGLSTNIETKELCTVYFESLPTLVGCCWVLKQIYNQNTSFLNLQNDLKCYWNELFYFVYFQNLTKIYRLFARRAPVKDELWRSAVGRHCPPAAVQGPDYDWRSGPGQRYEAIEKASIANTSLYTIVFG